MPRKKAEIEAKLNSFMRCLRCGVCCRETEMLLCQEDIDRLERQGYGKEFFTRFDKAGYATLRNREGCCVFYDAEKRKCNVYSDRPSGCRLYPIIFDEEKGIVIDNICHAQGVLTEGKKERKGKKVMKLLEKIDSEAKKRRSA